MKKQLGFTLIELMIVIAIIGILAAVAIPAYTDYLKRAKVGEAVNLMSGLKTPAEEYFASEGTPPALADLGAVTTSGKYTLSITDYNGSLSGKIFGYQAKMRDTNIATEPALVYHLDSSDNVKKWACGPLGGTEPQFLPASCRTSGI